MQIFVVQEEYWSDADCFYCAVAAFHTEEEAYSYISKQSPYYVYKVDEVELR